jgi:hypothetical protein
MRSSLERRFSETVRAELAQPGTRAPRFELLLPPALRESMVAAGSPPPLAAYYCERMPRLLIEQMLRGEDFARRLLWMPLDLSKLPRLSAALDGLFALLGEDAQKLTGAATPRALLAQRPCAAALAAPTLLGSGLPLVGAWPAERELINAAQGDPHAVFDLRLSGGLMHELCHGLRRPLEAPPPPWMVLEAAALLLGSLAFPGHVFPRQAGEAVPGVSLFVLLGQCLARLFGRRALLRTLIDAAPLADAFGPTAAEALESAAREEWLRRQEVPFARDALLAPAWVKLADAARAGRVVGLAEAAALPFDELPWWREEPAAEDLDLARAAVPALFQANVLAPTYQTHPCEAFELRLDTRTCLLQRPAQRQGVFGEPAFWIYPPPLCRRLRERGAKVVQIEGARRDHADGLLHLALGSGPLAEVVRWTSSA